LIFIPHWNNSDGGSELDTSRCYLGQVRYEALAELLPPESTVVGIDEHTALVIDPAGATGRVMGKGNVTITQDGRESVFLNRQTFDLVELGPFSQLSDPRVNIANEVWDRALTAKAETGLPKSRPVPCSEVHALLEKRQAARLQKDWARADEIRDKIESLGWRVMDTPEGSQLELIEDSSAR
jgi:hypothetical protein